jgi:hypothetical protein
LYRSASESGEEITSMTAVIPGVSRNAIGLSGVTMGLNVSAQLISLCLSLVVLAGLVTSLQRGVGAGEFIFFFSLLIIVAWPWSPIRFLVPLLPFLLYYFLLGTAEIYRLLTKALQRRPPRDRWAASRVVLIIIVGLYLYDHGLYIAATHADPTSWQYPEWRRQFNAVRQAERWIQSHTLESEVVAGDNVPITYLYSGRHTDMCDPAECAQKGVRYYVKAEDYDLSMPSRVVFQSSSPTVQVLDLLPSN